jgi:protein-tyrosine phosphatase
VSLVAALPQIPNFRDAGGLWTANGPLRTGALFRSSLLSRISSDDQAALLRLGIRQVFDLRTDEEVARHPDQLPPGIELTTADVLADRPENAAATVGSIVSNRDDPASIEAANAAVGDGRARAHMLDAYTHFVTLPSAHAGFRLVLTGVARADGASVIHCTAGKDRSGWAIAVTQLVAGASHDDVIADYLGSNAGMEVAYRPMLERFAAAGGDAEGLSHMIYVQRQYLETALAHVDREFGGVHGYLSSALGMDQADIDRLARVLAP